MLVMISNQSGTYAGYLAGRYPGQVGHLYSPGGQRGPWEFIPYALDNGKFPCFTKGIPWDVAAYETLLAWSMKSGVRPRWVLVPDEVADPVKTLDLWWHWYPYLKARGVPLAFAAQDGHTPSDVPKEADVVFVGGTTDWKYAAIPMFCEAFPRVHVGRINGYRGLKICESHSVESCDGTGWFRGGKNRLNGLITFLEEQDNAARSIFD